MVCLGRRLDQGVHADGFPVGESPDEPQALPKIVAVNEREGYRLDDPDPACLGNRRNQFRIAARVHGAADERDVDTCCPRKLAHRCSLLGYGAEMPGDRYLRDNIPHGVQNLGAHHMIHLPLHHRNIRPALGYQLSPGLLGVLHL